MKPSNPFLLTILFINLSFVKGQSSDTNTIYFNQSDYVIGSINWQYGEVFPTYDNGTLIAVCPLKSYSGKSSTSIVKLDSLGDFLWGTNIYGLYYDMDATEDKDGNIIISARDSLNYAYITKLDSLGIIQWSKKSTYITRAQAVISADGFHYLLGHINYTGTLLEDKFIAKFDGAGQTIWTKHYKTEYNGFIRDAIFNSKGDIVIASNVSNGNQVFGAHIFCIDTSGSPVWSKAFDYNGWSIPNTILEDTNGDYFVGGNMHIGSETKATFLKIDSIGNFLSSVKFDHTGIHYVTSVFQNENTYVIGISIKSYLVPINYETVYLIADLDGNITNLKLIDIDNEGSFNVAAYMDETGIITIGYNWTSYKLWVMRNNINGDFACNQIDEVVYSHNLYPGLFDLPLLVYDTLTFEDYSLSQSEINLVFNTVCKQDITNHEEGGSDDDSILDLLIVEMPNIFTPNGDGINDLFQFYWPYSEEFIFQIVNRWGQLVFETSSPLQFWNGQINNTEENVSDGVYYYKLTTGDQSKHGSLTLIR